MKQLYIIFMLTTSAHLFGAAAAGNTPQERFNNALQTGNVNLIVAAFADLDPADRRETTANYEQFARFIRDHLPNVGSAAYQGVMNLYHNNQHPIARWVVNGNPDRLDQQLEQFAADDAQVQDDMAQLPLDPIGVHDEDAVRAPDPVIQQRLFDDAEDPLDQGFYEPLFHRQPQAQPVPEIPASRHQETLQSKLYRTLAHAYINGRIPLQRIIATIQQSDPLHYEAHLAEFAREAYFAMYEDVRYFDILQNTFSNKYHQKNLLPYPRLTIQDYRAHNKAFEIYKNELFLNRKFLTSLDGIHLIPNIEQVRELVANNNKLTILPDFIGNLTHLMYLGLFNNELVTLPDTIGNLINLLTLDLSNNQLATLPESIGNLTHLLSLDAHNNQLTELPASIENLTNLIYFDLRGNNFSAEERARITQLMRTATNGKCQINWKQNY